MDVEVDGIMVGYLHDEQRAIDGITLVKRTKTASELHLSA